MLLTLVMTGVLAEEIYREVDEQGVTTFSDQAMPGGEKIEVREPMTFSDPLVREQMKRQEEKPSPGASAQVRYRVSITDPTPGSAVRNNAGNLTLQVSVDPILRQGHQVELTMNGSKIRVLGGSGSVALSNVDRGTHSFVLNVVDAKGKVIQKGEKIDITMLRFSRLH